MVLYFMHGVQADSAVLQGPSLPKTCGPKVGNGFRFDKAKSFPSDVLWCTNTSATSLNLKHIVEFIFCIFSIVEGFEIHTASTRLHLRLHCWDYVSQSMTAANAQWSRDRVLVDGSWPTQSKFCQGWFWKR